MKKLESCKNLFLRYLDSVRLAPSAPGACCGAVAALGFRALTPLLS